MGAASKPPKCRICDAEHWGLCSDHEARGYLSTKAAPATVPGAVGSIAALPMKEALHDNVSGKPKGASVSAKPKPAAVKKRLELAGGLWITADQIGGRILDAHPGVAADLVEQAARVVGRPSPSVDKWKSRAIIGRRSSSAFSKMRG